MLSYKHYTLEERKYLQELLEEGYSIRKIARALGRAPSSVSREIKRNSSSKGYHHWRAYIVSVQRRRKSHPMTRLAENTPLGIYVRESLSKFWPPECIAETWRLQHPDDPVGFSTIYRWLKRNTLSGFSRKTHLRRRGKRIQTRNALYNTIHPDRRISDWPEDIQNRLRIGDWEGDTVCGAPGKGRLYSCVDRKSRFIRAAKTTSKRPDETMEAVLKALEGLPVHSLSLDNGSEFASFREMEQALGAPIYFADPHAPWQRGTNENLNGLLRFFFPKGCDFLSVSDDELQVVVDLINERPRKCLGWKSPKEVFFS